MVPRRGYSLRCRTVWTNFAYPTLNSLCKSAIFEYSERGGGLCQPNFEHCPYLLFLNFQGTLLTQLSTLCPNLLFLNFWGVGRVPCQPNFEHCPGLLFLNIWRGGTLPTQLWTLSKSAIFEFSGYFADLTFNTVQICYFWVGEGYFANPTLNTLSKSAIFEFLGRGGTLSTQLWTLCSNLLFLNFWERGVLCRPNFEHSVQICYFWNF